MLVDRLEQVYLTSLEGLGSSYRMKGYFTLGSTFGSTTKVSFEGVAFGGNYGGHNVSVNISDEDKMAISSGASSDEIEDLMSEIQRRLLNNEMIVDYDNIKPETHENVDGLGLP